VIKRLWIVIIVACVVLLVSECSAIEPIQLSIDATRAGNRMLRVRMTIPMKPGPETLVYPKWIPGEHAPTGPINDLGSLRITAGGQRIPWQRDDVDMYAFHFQVPEGQSLVRVAFDILGTPDEGDFQLGNSADVGQMVLNWNQVVLYPSHSRVADVRIAARLVLPDGWKFDTALPITNQQGSIITFQTTSLEELVDSPVLAGVHFRQFDITPAGVSQKHYLSIVGPDNASINIPKSVVSEYSKLVREASAFFGVRHYDSYHFLVFLHGRYADGLEHQQSSDNRLPRMGLVDPSWRLIEGDLLPHELVHSWNGKYKRPIGLDTLNYQEPMKGDLLWVYEGLTNYMGSMLAVRSGLWSPRQFRDNYADLAAKLNNEPGRTWRPLEDTAVAAQILYGSSEEGASWRRSGGFPDFYSEGSLIWLEVDTIIRTRTDNKKSIQDFCRIFYGGTNGLSEVVPYTFEDVVSGLNEVTPYDWAGFFRKKLTSLSPHAPLKGLEMSGWRLTYTDKPSPLDQVLREMQGVLDMRYSIGALLNVDGRVVDVIPGSPADLSGLIPGMRITAVNGSAYSADALVRAIERQKNRTAPLKCTVRNGIHVEALRIKYKGGLKYPHLERIPLKPNMLKAILTPLTTNS